MNQHLWIRLAAIAGPLAIGCASPPIAIAPDHEAAAAPASGKPTSMLEVQNHLTFPYRLEKLVVAMDGALIEQRVYEPDDEPARLVTPLAGVPGDHALQMLAVVEVAQTAAGPECALELRRSDAFVLADGVPTTLTADLYPRGVVQAFEERVAMKVTVRGPGPSARAPGQDPRCQKLEGGEAAICRVEASVAAARRAKDIIKLSCNQEKLARMQSLLQTRGEAPDGADEHMLRARARAIDAGIEALGREADQCVGEQPIYFGGTQVRARECAAALGEAPSPAALGVPEIDRRVGF